MKSLRTQFVALTLLAAPALTVAQGGGTTLRTGLTYNPNDMPAVAVVPVKGGPYADSLAVIVQRDLQYSDRLTMLQLNAGDAALFYDAFKGLAYDFFTGLGARVVVEMTATQSRLNVKVHEVARHQAIATIDFAMPPASLSRDWRLAVRSEEHTSELQSHLNLVCRLLLEKKTTTATQPVRPLCIRYNQALLSQERVTTSSTARPSSEPYSFRCPLQTADMPRPLTATFS